MSDKTETWYVLYNGQPEIASKSEWKTFALAIPDIETAKQEFDDSIKEGFVTKNDGLYLVEGEGLTDEDIDKFLTDEGIDAVVKSGFKGYKTKEVEVDKASVDSWIPEAQYADLDDFMPDGILPDENGVITFRISDSNPYVSE